MWTFDDIASFLAVTGEQLERIIAAHPTFPYPVLLAPTVDGRWWAEAVIDWFATLAGWQPSNTQRTDTATTTAMRRPVQPKPAHTTPTRRASRG